MFSEDSDEGIGNYFRSNLLEVRNAVSAREFERFAALNNNGERVNFVLKYPEAHVLSVEVENVRKKDLSEAMSLKDAGNKCYAVGEYLRALENYSDAILIAPRKDSSILFANRSAVFHQIGKHELALGDIEECLKIGYPKELLYKVEERRAKCLLALENHEEAVEAFKNALLALDGGAKVSRERRQKMESDVRLMLAVMERGDELIEKKTKSKKSIKQLATVPRSKTNVEKMGEKDQPLPRIKDVNPLYPAYSKAVDIRCNDVVGRHGVATRDISPGELLLVEKPYSAVLLGEYRQSHCQNCFSKVMAPFPPACDTCDLVVYCSVRCRDSHAKIHESECKLLAPLWLSQASVTCLIALKVITQNPFAKLYDLKDDIENANHEISESRPYSSQDYLALHGLVTHEDERVADDLFHRAYIAGWLLRLLKTSDYFPDSAKTPDVGGQDLSEEEKFVAGILLHNLQLLSFNAHEISELVRKKGMNVTNAKSMFIGGGVYPTIALLNHSCNPGIIRYFIGTTMVVRAIRSIPAGSEICENYGPMFSTVEENERKRRLRLQYWFNCACEACVEHWPLMDDIDPRILRFKCEAGAACGNVIPISTTSNDFILSCKKCGKTTNIFKGLKALQDTDALYKVAMRHLENDNCTEALKTYLDILKLLDETLALPIRDYHLCQQGIRLCILALGNSSVTSSTIVSR